MYTCLCFQLVNSEVIAEGSWKFCDMEWLRIYSAAVKRGGMLHQNYYLSVGAIMAMVGMNDDAKASSSKYLPCKRNLRPGLGGQIVENPLSQKESDELAGKFRSGKTYLLTDLRYKCTSNQGGVTNPGHRILILINILRCILILIFFQYFFFDLLTIIFKIFPTSKINKKSYHHTRQNQY